MDAPDFYIVADGNAYAMEEDGYMYAQQAKQSNVNDSNSGASNNNFNQIFILICTALLFNQFWI